MLKSSNNINEINSLSDGSKMEGNLTTNSDIRIDGQLNGSLHTEGRLVLGETGIIEGEVICGSAIISGELKATIKTEGLLTLQASSKLSGEIIAGKLSVEPGAVFSGKCSMGPIIKDINKAAEKDKNSKSEKTA